MITPFRKPAGGELLDWQKEYNSEVNKIRWMVNIQVPVLCSRSGA